MSIAVIPARGGSKRIPGKNGRDFLGEPLVQRTVRVVADSGVFDRIVVSTDDERIAELALAAGAEVPFQRPAHLADDHTPTAPVVFHAIEALEVDAVIADVCAVYATAALMRPQDLRDAAGVFAAFRPDLLFAAARHPAPIERAWGLRTGGAATMRWPEHSLTRTQDLSESFYDVGWFYFATRAHWQTGDVTAAEVRLHVIDRLRAIDLDTEQDWRDAEAVAAVMSQP